jgi:hypothetical protein
VGCIATGAVVGGIGGLAFPVAGAALGALGVTGLGATLGAGGAAGLASGLASQTLAGHYDVGQLALDTLAGAATAGLLKGAGSLGSRILAGIRGGAADAGGAGASSATPRLPQDVNVNPRAPLRLPPNRPVGLSPTQNQAVQTQIANVRGQGATDIRVNQQQVNVNRVRVGINRPDLQYTLNGVRYYEEYDIPSSTRGVPHRDRILANDPAGIVDLFTVP